MNITVIGATSRTGRHVLVQGVQRGHEITAFTRRRPEELIDQPGLAEIVSGDARDEDSVRVAVSGSEAVIAIVAATSRKGPHQAAAVARNVIRVMADEGSGARLVVTSAYPVVAQTSAHAAS